jgi:hypothetical protein
VIIRRPHAYDFLMQAYADRVEDRGKVRGSEAGVEVGDLVLPLPGFYVLDAGGKVLGKCGLGSVEDLVAFLGDKARP